MTNWRSLALPITGIVAYLGALHWIWYRIQEKYVPPNHRTDLRAIRKIRIAYYRAIGQPNLELEAEQAALEQQFREQRKFVVKPDPKPKTEFGSK